MTIFCSVWNSMISLASFIPSVILLDHSNPTRSYFSIEVEGVGKSVDFWTNRDKDNGNEWLKSGASVGDAKGDRNDSGGKDVIIFQGKLGFHVSR